MYTMTVNYFRVSGSDELAKGLKDIYNLHRRSLDSRELPYAPNKTVFLEYLRPNGDLLEMEFTQRTPEGPGYSEPDQNTRDFRIPPGGGFAQHTAAILSGDYMAVQYNHNGPRHSVIPKYVQHLCPNLKAKVELNVLLDREVDSRFMGSRIQKKLVIGINRLNTLELLHDGGIGLNAALEMGERTDSGVVEIVLSNGGGKRGGPLRNVVETVLDLLNKDRGSLTKLQARVQGEDGKVETLNLLEHLEHSDIPTSSLSLSGQGRYGRYTYSSRMSAMRQEFRKWLARTL